MTPIAAPYCRNCEQPIQDGDLALCPNCGATLNSGKQSLSKWSWIGVLLLLTFSVGSGSCAISILRDLRNTDYSIRDFAEFCAKATLVVAALAIAGIIYLLRPLWKK